MGERTLNGIEAPAVEVLKARAAYGELSLDQAVRHILRKPAPLSVEDRVALSRLIRAMTPDVPQTDGAETVREDRGTRCRWRSMPALP
jgi:hypothetical protein